MRVCSEDSGRGWSHPCNPIDQLQVGSEPETGVGRKMAGSWRNCKRPFWGKAENGRANGRIAEIWHFLPVRPFAWPFFFAIFGLRRHMAAGHSAGHFQFRAHFPPAACQRGRKATPQKHMLSETGGANITRKGLEAGGGIEEGY